MKRCLSGIKDGEAEASGYEVVIQTDTTYWGRNFGVVIFMDAHTHKVLHFKFIDRKERLRDYAEGISRLQSRGFVIKAVVSDGLHGLNELCHSIPYQYCQFHQLQRIKQLLTNSPRLEASSELKAIASGLTSSTKDVFEEQLSQWHGKWKGFINEQTVGERGRRSFTHRRTRSAYYSLKRHLDILFTYQTFTEGYIPNTNNALESLNSVLKMRLRLHRGVSCERRKFLISSILSAYNPMK